MRYDCALAFNLLGEIIALVAFAAEDNTTVERVLGYSCTSREQFAATIAPIAVEHHLIPFILVERLTI